MKNKKNNMDRLCSLNNKKSAQMKRKRFYIEQIAYIKKLINQNRKELDFNNGWIKFHKNSIKKHKQEIRQTCDLNYKNDQEEKIIFHKNQIDNHHNKNIMYHDKEIVELFKELELFQNGIKRCQSNIEFLNNKINNL